MNRAKILGTSARGNLLHPATPVHTVIHVARWELQCIVSAGGGPPGAVNEPATTV